MQSEESIYVFHPEGTDSAQSVPRKMERSPKWHGRIPAQVLLDPAISADAVRVYGILALFVFQGNSSYVGMRRLGELAGFSQQTAMRKIAELSKAGHITVSKDKKGKRSTYVLNSAVFGQKQRDGVEEIVSNPSGSKRLVSVRVA